jgi:hypothetical protein
MPSKIITALEVTYVVTVPESSLKKNLPDETFSNVQGLRDLREMASSEKALRAA